MALNLSSLKTASDIATGPEILTAKTSDNSKHIPASVIAGINPSDTPVFLYTDNNNALKVNANLNFNGDGTVKVSDPAWGYLGLDGNKLLTSDVATQSAINQVRDLIGTGETDYSYGNTMLGNLRDLKSRLPGSLTSGGRLMVDAQGGVSAVARRPDGSFNTVASTQDDKLKIALPEDNTVSQVFPAAGILEYPLPATLERGTVTAYALTPGGGFNQVIVEFQYQNTWYPLYGLDPRFPTATPTNTLANNTTATVGLMQAAIPAGATSIRVNRGSAAGGNATLALSVSGSDFTPLVAVTGGVISASISNTPALAGSNSRIGAVGQQALWNRVPVATLPLAAAANQSYNGTTQDVAGTAAGSFVVVQALMQEFRASSVSDQPHFVRVEMSEDNTNWEPCDDVAAQQLKTSTKYTSSIAWRPTARYMRAVFVNGSTAATSAKMFYGGLG